MEIAVTGHRPTRLFQVDPYSEQNFRQLAKFASSVMGEDVSHVLTGMALGLDQAFAQACFERDIPYTACVPCDDHERGWPAAARSRYRKLLYLAEHVIVVSPGEYQTFKMQQRNQYMVDRCEQLFALWDGQPKGGTYNCVRYAQDRGVTVRDLWRDWQKFLSRS